MVTSRILFSCLGLPSLFERERWDRYSPLIMKSVILHRLVTHVNPLDYISGLVILKFGYNTKIFHVLYTISISKLNFITYWPLNSDLKICLNTWAWSRGVNEFIVLWLVVRRHLYSGLICIVSYFDIHKLCQITLNLTSNPNPILRFNQHSALCWYTNMSDNPNPNP